MKKVALSITVIAILLLFTCGCNDYSYNIFGSISGTVTDSESGLPISGTVITLVPGSSTQQTSNDGKFFFPELEEGQYTISVQKSGYQANRKNVRVISDMASEIVIQLRSIPQ